MLRVCSKCKEEKPSSEFYKRVWKTRSGDLRNGAHHDCKSCRRQADAIRSKGRHQRDPRVDMMGKAKERAKKTGIPFDLDKSDIVIPKSCPVLGIPISIGRGRHTDNSPTLDRLIPSLGYVRGNVAVVSYRANRIKNDATPEELQAVATWTKEQTRHE